MIPASSKANWPPASWMTPAELNQALGFDMNTVEFAVRDGVPYAIDFLNVAPDMDYHSVGPVYFEWVVENMARLVHRARAERLCAGPPSTAGTRCSTRRRRPLASAQRRSAPARACSGFRTPGSPSMGLARYETRQRRQHRRAAGRRRTRPRQRAPTRCRSWKQRPERRERHENPGRLRPGFDQAEAKPTTSTCWTPTPPWPRTVGGDARPSARSATS